MSTHEEGPGCRSQPGPSHHLPEPNSAAALQDTVLCAQDSRLARRIATLYSVGAAWEHFRARGLTSETVRDTLQRCLRDAA